MSGAAVAAFARKKSTSTGGMIFMDCLLPLYRREGVAA